ncbi:MAG: helix-turn-helix domain-containing protein [Alistipes indistinctus]
MPEEKFKSPRRTREIAQARQIAMYLSKQHTSAADYYRGFDRRKEPCDGTPCLQGDFEPDGDRQSVPSPDRGDREARVGEIVSSEPGE